MEINEYQKKIVSKMDELQLRRDTNFVQMNSIAGMKYESKDCLEYVDFYQQCMNETNRKRVAEKLSHIAQYLAVAADAFGYDLETVLSMGIDE